MVVPAEGAADEVRVNIGRQGQMTADLSNGNVYWTMGNSQIWKYDRFI